MTHSKNRLSAAFLVISPLCAMLTALQIGICSKKQHCGDSEGALQRMLFSSSPSIMPAFQAVWMSDMCLGRALMFIKYYYCTVIVSAGSCDVEEIRVQLLFGKPVSQHLSWQSCFTSFCLVPPLTALWEFLSLQPFAQCSKVKKAVSLKLLPSAFRTTRTE